MAVDFSQSYATGTFNLTTGAVNITYLVGKPNDSGAGIYINLINNVGAIVNPTVETMILYATRPDGTKVYFVGENELDRIRIDFNSSIYEVVGNVSAEIQLIDSNGLKKTSNTFTINASEQVFDASYVKSTDDFRVLKEALDDVKYVESELQNITPEQINHVTVAEQGRVSAEQGRVIAEQGRVDAEYSRASAEGVRANAESNRQTAESARVVAESSRVNAESARSSNEAERILHEDDRVADETLRASAESTRISNETARGTVEINRVNAESARVTSEQGRVTAEQGRVNAENSRVATLNAKADKTYVDSQIDTIDSKIIVGTDEIPSSPLPRVADRLGSLSEQDITSQLADIELSTNESLSAIATEQNTQNNRLTDLESRAIKTYGARRTLNATSPLLERIFDAAGKVANVPTDDGAAVNDFDNIFPWSHIRECKRDSTGRIHYKGDPGYDLLTNVDWLIEIPKFYIRMQRTATTFDRVISEIKRAGFWVPSVFKRADGTECDKIYVGRFKTGIVDGVNVSRPGIFPENFRDLASFRTGARAKGAGWQLIDISYKTEVLDMLYIIESATLNSQVYLGNGITTVRYVATDLAQIAETAVNRIVVTNAMAGNYNVGENICIGTAQGSENIARDRTILSKAALPDGVNTEIVFDGDPVNIAVGNVLWQGAQKNGQTVNLQKPNGKLSGVSGRTSNKYRGMEDIFGNVYEWVDGVLISERIAQICKDPAKYASTLTADYKPVGYTNLATDGYPLEMGFDSNFPEAIFPTTPGGGTTTGYCDYYYQNTGLRGACFGGYASGGVFAGVFSWSLYGAPALSSWLIGSRLLFKPPV